MGKRNQYNRSTLPLALTSTVSGSISGSFAGVVINANLSLQSPTGSFTISPINNNVMLFLGADTYTGSIDISGMQNGQRLEIITIQNGFLLSSSNPSAGQIYQSGITNTASIGAHTYSIWYYLSTSSFGANLLVRSYTGSLP